ncbi:hypothetical protein [Planomonospora sp. ID82291]|uniref:hypothetical protein n=1 Tax=Planomonospora sp. ID82291 TaxID=2738136 RepID=UPI0018C36621|nr:hypothetical protein [Planomonospora sp. ID82291]MBG0818352.1 hypothetical protein [Planomonospora sp. ID82291]
MLNITDDTGTTTCDFASTSSTFTISPSPKGRGVFLDLGDWGVTLKGHRMKHLKLLLSSPPSTDVNMYVGLGFALTVGPDGDGIAIDLQKVFLFNNTAKVRPVGCGITIPADGIPLVIDALDAALAAASQ